MKQKMDDKVIGPAVVAKNRKTDIDLLRFYLLQSTFSSDDDETITIETTTKQKRYILYKQNKNQKLTQFGDNSSGSSANHFTTTNKTTTTVRTFMIALRSVLIDFPMMVLFWMLLTVYCLRIINDTYISHIITNSERTDTDLLKEFTYYERQCDYNDLSFSKSTKDKPSIVYDIQSQSIEPLMKHGAIAYTDLLSPDTVTSLRKYVTYRNANIHKSEKYPVSNGYKRLSYGLDATEDESVVQALKEISNNKHMEYLLQQTLGINPAVTEITQITSYYGAEDQVWHSDTKADGNGAKYARTYSHSYTLFIPLQDTTTKMGVTKMCPGTHYCSNDIGYLCEKHSIGVNEAFPPVNTTTSIDMEKNNNKKNNNNNNNT